jgi:NAD(P)-dependent dehydrogenase (short-subunit alcohol dehydrogenase family)
MPQWGGRPNIDLRGKRILLTGASSGIGAVAAGKLAATGATVIAVARREPLLHDVVERIIASEDRQSPSRWTWPTSIRWTNS